MFICKRLREQRIVIEIWSFGGRQYACSKSALCRSAFAIVASHIIREVVLRQIAILSYVNPF